MAGLVFHHHAFPGFSAFGVSCAICSWVGEVMFCSWPFQAQSICEQGLRMYHSYQDLFLNMGIRQKPVDRTRIENVRCSVLSYRTSFALVDMISMLSSPPALRCLFDPRAYTAVKEC